MPGHYDNSQQQTYTTTDDHMAEDYVGKALTAAAVGGGATAYMMGTTAGTPVLNGVLGRFLPGNLPFYQSAAIAAAGSSMVADSLNDYILPYIEKEVNLKNPGAVVQRGMSAGLSSAGVYYLMDPRFLSDEGRGMATLIGYGAGIDLAASLLWPAIKPMVLTA